MEKTSKIVKTLDRSSNKNLNKDSENIVVLDVPSFVFKDRSLSVLEVMVEYLKDVKKYSYHEIALMLNRDDRTIWTVYSRVKEKRRTRNE